MRIVWSGNLYPPVGGGAEWMAHEFLLACIRRGHSVRFWHHRLRTAYQFEGVDVVLHAKTADVVIGHLGTGHAEVLLAERAKAALYWLLHSPSQHPPRTARPIANSLHVQRTRPGSLLLRPHVPTQRYDGRRGSAMTLVNLSQLKGVRVLEQLVRLRPDLDFLGVRGAWDEQAYKPGRYDNLTVWEFQPDVRIALTGTKLLLLPSREESWGRIAVEAACRGIPTLAHPCDGVLESMAEAAVYADREYPEAWSEAIDLALGQYDRLSRLARHRASYLEDLTGADAEALISHLEDQYG